MPVKAINGRKTRFWRRDMTDRKQGPLAGIRVLDFSTLLPGPLATLMLAEAGAEVIKIERPDGEDMRRFEPRWGEESVAFAHAQPRQEERGGRPQGPEGPRPYSRAGQVGRCRGRAIPPRRHGPARPRLHGLPRRQSAHRLLRHHRLRPDRPAQQAAPATTSITSAMPACWRCRPGRRATAWCRRRSSPTSPAPPIRR